MYVVRKPGAIDDSRNITKTAMTKTDSQRTDPWRHKGHFGVEVWRCTRREENVTFTTVRRDQRRLLPPWSKWQVETSEGLVLVEGRGSSGTPLLTWPHTGFFHPWGHSRRKTLIHTFSLCVPRERESRRRFCSTLRRKTTDGFTPGPGHRQCYIHKNSRGSGKIRYTIRDKIYEKYVIE